MKVYILPNEVSDMIKLVVDQILQAAKRHDVDNQGFLDEVGRISVSFYPAHFKVESRKPLENASPNKDLVVVREDNEC